MNLQSHVRRGPSAQRSAVSVNISNCLSWQVVTHVLLHVQFSIRASSNEHQAKGGIVHTHCFLSSRAVTYTHAACIAQAVQTQLLHAGHCKTAAVPFPMSNHCTATQTHAQAEQQTLKKQVNSSQRLLILDDFTKLSSLNSKSSAWNL